ncbi:MAG: biotin--[acetyl-CoA-carboxylase] ligase [Chloroflexi bacterium]|nr:biotin--[acetyl-CoA-carboxylase] ligase [Chloroflexota bacterium]
MKIDFTRLAGPFPGSDRTVGSEIRHFASVTSTMDVAWDLANSGAVDGTVVVADHQSAGRGRFDRSWVSDHGLDILCSVVLRPRASLTGELLMLAALTVVDVAGSFDIDAGIKWPNDVQVGGKKLAGVIAESVTGPARSETSDAPEFSPEVGPEGDNVAERAVAVIGIGLNVNSDFSDHGHEGLEATSLSAELGKQIDRLAVFEKLLWSLDKYYFELSAGGSILHAWREKLTTIGRMVTVVSGDARGTTNVHGLAHDVDSSGRLIVRDANGRDWPVSAGEVTVQEVR